jgi:RNA-splicing ligase RtcB
VAVGAGPQQVTEKLWSWASELDDQTLAQAERTARLPIVDPYVALMPDAHLGKGATVGSVIPTVGAVIPAAVGVDIGCGVIAVETDLDAAQLPDRLEPLLHQIERRVPAGVGRGHDQRTKQAERWLRAHDPSDWRRKPFTDRQRKKTLDQFGTLGAGNHFLELCVDERGYVWVELHSGSRGVGNELAMQHIERAQDFVRREGISLEDRDLAYLVESTQEFDDYVADMLWAQDYALANRERMMDVTLDALFQFVGGGREVERINCHHNFAVVEQHGGEPRWVTRKGAIRARHGEAGVIPGSMATSTYVVRGLGNERSFHSCAHGAGRRHSRTRAKKLFNAEQLGEWMGERAWNRERARSLVDEIPDAYKPVELVMEDQRDLVEPVHTLRQVLNYKG